ncbi:hypothetical protein NDU88_003924 [Pleurodeles waltl]|uniref:Uncharacterized protein n=1 Tax=Pleurodeles waltl TaxID=8319 RepID=A0AAV7PJK4_PLEWA|nr:hypothetical protein NDU88_003924 [Pleurodeles waltl]
MFLRVDPKIQLRVQETGGPRPPVGGRGDTASVCLSHIRNPWIRRHARAGVLFLCPSTGKASEDPTVRPPEGCLAGLPLSNHVPRREEGHGGEPEEGGGGEPHPVKRCGPRADSGPAPVSPGTTSHFFWGGPTRPSGPPQARLTCSVVRRGATRPLPRSSGPVPGRPAAPPALDLGLRPGDGTAPRLLPQAPQSIRGKQVAAARPFPVACSAASAVLRHFGTVGSSLAPCKSQAEMLNGSTGGAAIPLWRGSRVSGGQS